MSTKRVELNKALVDAVDTESVGRTDAELRNAILDSINHPKHYSVGGIEVINAVEAWDLGFHLGNVVKYIVRCKHKGKRLEDLKKAKWYLDRYIALIDAKTSCGKP